MMSEPLNVAPSSDTDMEIGVVTLGEFLKDPIQGQKISAQQRIQEIIDAARLADEAGLDVFGGGRASRPGFRGFGGARRAGRDCSGDQTDSPDQRRHRVKHR